MKKFKVDYQSGQSRYSEKEVDWMLAVAPLNGEDIELYAEADPQEDEYGSYNELKAEIISQAKKHNISLDTLEFWLD